MMRVLTVRQPWAWAIIHGGKNVENRIRNVAGSYRGPVAIHTALADAENAPEALWLEHAKYYLPRVPRDAMLSVRGAIIGVVDLVDVHHCFNALTKFEGCSPWAELDAWHLVLENPRPLGEPIPFRGALGLRTLPADVEAAVLAGVAR